MSEPEFPQELIERCAREAAKVWTSEDKKADIVQAGVLFQPTVRAVLRESGHAELVAELKEARVWLDASLGMVRGEGPPNWDGIRDAATRIDSVLRKAGAL